MATASRRSAVVYVVVRWRDDILAFTRIREGGRVALGAVPGTLAPIPGLPDEGLVFARAQRGIAIVSAPPGAALAVTRAQGSVERIEGPAELALHAGDAAHFDVGDYHVSASAEHDEAVLFGRRRRDLAAFAGVAFAALAHAVIFALSAQDAAASTEDVREEARTRDLAAMLGDAEQHSSGSRLGEGETQGGSVVEERGSEPVEGQRAGGARAPDEAGKRGQREASVPARRGPGEEPRAREDAIGEARAFGMIGLIGHEPPGAAESWTGEIDAPAAPGGLWGEPLPGAGGLALSGVGEGTGGRGEGVGLGTIRGLGHIEDLARRGGAGVPARERGAHARGAATLGPRRAGVGPSVCVCGEMVASGRLPPEAIQRVVRQHFGRFRGCYERGLAPNPSLAGRVSARFVIGRTGGVESVADGGSSMPDPQVTACVLGAFRGISFPPPEGGIVTVTYPITFSPD